MNSWLEVVIAGVIVLGILVAILRTGQANPQPTGRLMTRILKVEGDFEGIKHRVGEMEKTLEAMERQMATKEDIEHLEKLMERDAATSKKTWDAIQRLENFFLQDAINGRKGR